MICSKIQIVPLEKLQKAKSRAIKTMNCQPHVIFQTKHPVLTKVIIFGVL